MPRTAAVGDIVAGRDLALDGVVLGSDKGTRDGFVMLTGFTLNLGKLSMASLRNVSGLASWRHAENGVVTLTG